MKIRYLLCVLCLVLTACNSPQPTRPASVDTVQLATVVAATLQALYTPTATATEIVLPTNTPTLTPTYTTPLLTFTGDTNCRSGPGTDYEVLTVIPEKTQVEIVGLPPKGNYWVVKNPAGSGTCWVAGDFAQASGSFAALPTMPVPPTSTPEPPSAPIWQSYNYSCAFASGGSNMTMELAWSYRGKPIDGFNLYRNDQLVTTLGPDAASYTDTYLVTAGQTVNYVLEAYNAAGKVRSSAVGGSCQ